MTPPLTLVLPTVVVHPCPSSTIIPIPLGTASLRFPWHLQGLPLTTTSKPPKPNQSGTSTSPGGSPLVTSPPLRVNHLLGSLPPSLLERMPVRAVGFGAKMGSRDALDTGDNGFSTKSWPRPKKLNFFKNFSKKFEEQNSRTTWSFERLRDSHATKVLLKVFKCS